MKKTIIAIAATLLMAGSALADRLPVNDINRAKPIKVPTGIEVKDCADLKMKRDGSFVKACSEKAQIRKQLKDAVNREGQTE